MRRLVFICTAAACGPAYHMTPGPQPYVDTTRWFHAPEPCGFGPYEIALELAPLRWGEDIVLLVATPRRRIALTAAILVNGVEVARAANTYDSVGINIGRPDNARCVAPPERVVVAPVPPPSEQPPELQPSEPPPAEPLVEEMERPPLSGGVVHHRLGERAAPTRVVLRIWSDVPNDLDGVHFGAMQRVWNRVPL